MLLKEGKVKKAIQRIKSFLLSLSVFFPQSRGASVQSKKTPSEEEFETIKLISNGAYG